MGVPLLHIENLGVTFDTHHGLIHASHSVNLTLHAGDILGIVGESGSGKSVSMMAVARLLPSYAQTSGSILYKNIPIHQLNHQAFKAYRGKKILYLFQDPLTALNPYLRVGKQLIETIRLHQKVDKSTAQAIAEKLLAKVHLTQSDRVMRLYPHQCSGGMRQRILLALALACQPEILIADEPTSALDAITAAQIMQLLDQLRKEEGLSIILISHDLPIVQAICSHISVFYQGTIIESNTKEAIIGQPQAPYTQALLHAMHQME
ncbi:ABC transporter ATP-binding protein [Entomospira culicis]|uniref:ABC transporter ATP-binding protein n=1 Tax=Entomospira culicis TaxID=2719989 RepID=A0A968KZ19_9SPIO|nr:ABC transporter ATP-binding protein [Entomospira culicis]NIZ18656.1 ABC transporter ATP-binding protein [Entomospira culicis]NIZ68871.1 ABC transporter ATP-binding protein [Entomospira culicis]WDI37464.1 ABC transporter ATP-binding protein [Entomospira culicis]WDI39092.1 ABC transporter ATP-binding protein [Entomospira culicis]